MFTNNKNKMAQNKNTKMHIILIELPLRRLLQNTNDWIPPSYKKIHNVQNNELQNMYYSLFLIEFPPLVVKKIGGEIEFPPYVKNEWITPS